MKKVLTTILSLFLITVSILTFGGSTSKVNAVNYTGKLSYSNSKPLNMQGFLSKYNNDLESVTLSVINNNERIAISRMDTSYLNSAVCSALYDYWRNQWYTFIVPIDFEVHFGEYSFHYPVNVLFEIIPTSITKYPNFLYFDVRILNYSFGSLELKGEVLEHFLDLFYYKDGYNPSVRFYLNLIDSSFSHTLDLFGVPVTIDFNASAFDGAFAILSNSNMSFKIDFKLRNTYKVGKIYTQYAGAGFHSEDFIYNLTGTRLNLSIGVNNSQEIFAYSSGTTKKNFASNGLYERHLLLTFDDYVEVNSIQLYLYSRYSTVDDIITQEHFEYCVFLQYLQIYDLYTDVIIPGGGYSSDRLINYKSVEWYDIPGHLSNFLVWLLYDSPIISPLFSMIYTMFSFSDVFLDNFLLFSSLGAVFVILAGIFGFMVLIKALKE